MQSQAVAGKVEPMLPMVAWMIGLAVSVGALVIAAAGRQHLVHAALCCAVALGIALAAVKDQRSAMEAGAPPTAVASISARYMGLVWAWGAIVLIVTYTFVLSWKEWWQFALAFGLLAGLCLFFANTLDSDASRGDDDPGMMSLARYLSIGQLIGTALTAVGLLVFDGRAFKLGGKMTRFMDPRHTDWAANNVFLFGALALAAISYMSLKETRPSG